MKNKFDVMRGKESMVEEPKTPPPLARTDFFLSMRVDNGIKLGCPFCTNTSIFEEYRHNTEADKQFYRCLQCLGTFDFTIYDVSKPPTPPASLPLLRNRRRRR